MSSIEKILNSSSYPSIYLFPKKKPEYAVQLSDYEMLKEEFKDKIPESIYDLDAAYYQYEERQIVQDDQLLALARSYFEQKTDIPKVYKVVEENGSFFLKEEAYRTSIKITRDAIKERSENSLKLMIYFEKIRDEFNREHFKECEKLFCENWGIPLCALNGGLETIDVP